MREPSTSKKTLRCAIYARKSSEEGLEQDFNSLHAQREACEAYIASQRHEGWKALATVYDDGGFSGGSMARPALQKLLADIQSGSIDIIVVYKVDRLTRALTDFARMVEIFDSQGVSFVSVTQQFNTTTSMGRLTLNVLLSFAQFEREVTGERIRDKIAASKKKGLWMGGWVPIGYDARDRTLVINEPEAETIRILYRLYARLKNVRAVEAALQSANLTTKRYVATTGRNIGGRPFSRGHIYKILSNPLYIGEIDHKGTRHPGQHPAIIDAETWSAVQEQLRTNGHEKRSRTNARHTSLLAGLLFDENGGKFTAAHAAKNGKRYIYYVAPKHPVKNAGANAPTPAWIPAADLDSIVIQHIVQFLESSESIVRELGTGESRPSSLSSLLKASNALAVDIREAATHPRRAILEKLLDRVVVAQSVVRIRLKRNEVLERLAPDTHPLSPDHGAAIELQFDTQIVRGRTENTLVVSEAGFRKPATGSHAALLKAVARGHRWFEDLVSGLAQSTVEIARREGVTDRYVSKMLELSFLPPSRIEKLVKGTALSQTRVARIFAEIDPIGVWR